MPTYNFKQEAEVYVVSGGTTYRIDVTDINFSQTFSEESYPVNTIHSPNDLFEASVINTANVAQFNFIVPAIVQSNYAILETLLLNVSEFDLYIKTAADVYRLRQSVITNGSFVIERSRPLSLEISGDAAQLYKGVTGFTPSSAVTAKSYTLPVLEVSIDGSALTDITGVTLELQNDIEWTPYTTVNKAVSSTTMYPSGFKISKKILAGSITQYLTDGNSSNANSFDSTASISIKAGNGQSNPAFRGFSFGPATCSFTNRISVGPVFRQSYDWRLTQNTTLSQILKYTTD